MVMNSVYCPRNWADIAQRQTASVYLKELADIGVLEEKQAGREKLFVNPKLIQLMTQHDNEIAPCSAP